VTTLHIALAGADDDAIAGPDSTYAELVWLPVLGPASFLLWRQLARRLLLEPDGFASDWAELAVGLGIGGREGTPAGTERTLRRLERFGAAHLVSPALLLVPTALPPVPRHRLVQQHPIVLCRHEWLVAHRVGKKDRTIPAGR
jgi:hypothetical protein